MLQRTKEPGHDIDILMDVIYQLLYPIPISFRDIKHPELSIQPILVTIATKGVYIRHRCLSHPQYIIHILYHANLVVAIIIRRLIIDESTKIPD